MELELVTAEAVKYKGSCSQVILPGALGEMGVLPAHEPLVTMLEPGLVRVDTDKGNVRYVVSAGFATVAHDHVICLVDAALEAEEIKVEAVNQKIAKLESEVAGLPEVPLRTRTELKFLKAQLRLAGVS
jgi:F-type H+-transporting ATPase subunit epsilon